jgi:hypothetical protein
MSTGGIGTPDERFTQNGANAGFCCIFKDYPKAGFAILTNGDPWDTMYELVTALIRTYGWG